jgi:transcriptional regulator with XRE-family HTH domain
MNIQTIGTIIKHERVACGLSQKALADASHLSRVTIVNLENGKVGDIGAVKLSELADIVGKPIFSTGKQMDFVQMLLGSINTSYKTSMTKAQLEALILNGEFPTGYEGQLFHLIEEASIALLTGAVKQLAIQRHSNPKQMWKNLAKLAVTIQSPKSFWQAVNG